MKERNLTIYAKPKRDNVLQWVSVMDLGGGTRKSVKTRHGRETMTHFNKGFQPVGEKE